MTDQNMTRRRALTTAAGAGMVLPVLAACGSGSSNATSGSNPGTSSPNARSGQSPGGSSGTPLVKTSQIQVGGGEIFQDQNVVVTQPTQGSFKAFSATCTHQGCQVGSISNGTIVCPCHGSQFSIATGAVEVGPAPAPLPPVKITVSGGEITLAG